MTAIVHNPGSVIHSELSVYNTKEHQFVDYIGLMWISFNLEMVIDSDTVEITLVWAFRQGKHSSE